MTAKKVMSAKFDDDHLRIVLQQVRQVLLDRLSSRDAPDAAEATIGETAYLFYDQYVVKAAGSTDSQR